AFGALCRIGMPDDECEVVLIITFANPTRFLALIRWVMPVASVLSVALLAAGLWLAFFGSPVDYQQGETVRIMYIHVPAAWMAVFIYTPMAVASIVGLVWKHVVAKLYARAAAPFGAGFTLICL